MKHAFKLSVVTGLGLSLAAASAKAELIYGLTTDNNIFSFDSATPGTILSGHYVTGLAANESLVGIDYRDSSGQLYAVSTFGNLYTINPATAAITGGVAIAGATLNGTSFDIDYNNTNGLLRLVSDADQNLVINPVTGLATVLPNLTASYGNPNIAGIASPVAGTSLFAIDAGQDSLNLQDLATGVQTLQASVKDASINPVDVTGLLGFDLGVVGTGFVAVQQGGNGYSQFSAINLGTGVMTPIIAGNSVSGLIGGGLFVRDIAAAPEPASLALVGVAGLGLLSRRRKA